ncbi:MAG: hypothetical protein RL701_7271 [Pseudomonadota bacterium]
MSMFEREAGRGLRLKWWLPLAKLAVLLVAASWSCNPPLKSGESSGLSKLSETQKAHETQQHSGVLAVSADNPG